MSGSRVVGDIPGKLHVAIVFLKNTCTRPLREEIEPLGSNYQRQDTFSIDL